MFTLFLKYFVSFFILSNIINYRKLHIFKRGDILNNLDMNKLLGLLGSMNKEDLQKAILQANQIMNSENKEQLINDLKKKIK